MPTPLFLVDNSRLRAGRAACERLRYLEYHSGPTGYGIRLKRQALPLVTGIGLHAGLNGILSWTVKQGGGQRLPPREFVREVVAGIAFSYYKRCEARGFIGIDDALKSRTVREQMALIEGSLWGAWRCLLPAVLREHRVIFVEEEGPVIPVGCTCGLGDCVPPYTAHEERDCEATGIMTRADVVLERLADRALINLDFKSAGDVTEYSWAERQNAGMQFALQCASLRQVGYPVTETLVGGMNKGWRKAATEQDEDGKWRVTQESSADKKQNSLFCWAWKRPGNPPLMSEDWKYTNKWKELDPKSGLLVGRGVTKDYSKSPIWEAQFENKPKDWTVLEYWVEWLPQDVVAKEFSLAGPFTSSQAKVDAILRSIAHEGNDWKSKLWKIYEQLVEAGGNFAAEKVQVVLDQEVPQSWACIQYRSACQFRHVCDRREGWATPLDTGLYELRSPHHTIEAEQAKSRGIELPLDQEEDEEQE